MSDVRPVAQARDAVPAGREIIAVRRLSKHYATSRQPVVALQGIDFAIDEGEFVARSSSSGSASASPRRSCRPRSPMDVAGQFSILLILSLLGLALNACITLVRNRVLFWDPSRKATPGEPGEGGL